ncbi:hypothetical protein ACFOYU_12770 [Microvirga sp. GCM10011540]|uniref:hypothetical protein n=1 Tax=Microvirga sp. GCM10011540 TaxID=3317338 RepID=UPI00361FC1B3
MISRAAAQILAGFVEAEGGTASLAEDPSCPSNLCGIAGNRPFKAFVVGSQTGEGSHRWKISVPLRVLDDDLGITVLGAIKSSPMVCTFIFMPRAFLRILGQREGSSVWVGLSVNPFKGGFVTDDRPWPIIQETAAGFPPEPVPYVSDQGEVLLPIRSSRLQ